MANQKHQKCKERRKYYLAAFLFVLISLLLAELDILSFVIKKYKDIRDWANDNDDIKFFSSFCTIFGVSVIGYLQRRFLRKEEEFNRKEKKLDEKIEAISNQIKGEYYNQEENLREKLTKKRQELVQKISSKEDPSSLLVEIQKIEEKIKEIQDKKLHLGEL